MATPFTRGAATGFLLIHRSALLHLAGKVARAARQTSRASAARSSWAAQLPRLAFVLAGAFRGGEA